MNIYSGISLVYAHVVGFIQQIGGWFQEVIWSDFVNQMPLPFIPFVTAFLVILLSMAAVGLVKKLSFLLG